MTVLLAEIEAEQTTFTLGDSSLTVPVGPARLSRTDLETDPPRPEELTNAIGAVVDHLEDLLRIMPDVVHAEEVHLSGPDMRGFADVEAGHPVELPFAVSQVAAEEVFRILATETSAERMRNPGLPAQLAPTIVGGCCIVVAIMRRLHLDQVTIVEPSPGSGQAGAPANRPAGRTS
jgi:exopolyphosphatase/guanosine-5'-triphosphate,3'-diphosphate pyrophosphatase